MVDPVSITAGVGTLLGVIWKLGNELDKFRHDVSTIDADLLMLIENVEGLRQVTEAMKATFDKPEITDIFNATGHIGDHWDNIDRSICDTEGTMSTLLGILEESSKTTKFLDASRKLLRFRMADERLQRFASQIASCKGTLQLSLQTISL
jgi:hypothetical protein